MEELRYRQLRPLHGNDFHTCFYCGCLATEFDFAPPVAHWQSFFVRQASADNLKLPCCHECQQLLKGCAMGLVEQRREWLQTKIAAKYAKAIGVYLKWNSDELAELDYGLRHSIGAGLALGEEAHRRSNYSGYPYEVDGAAASQATMKPLPIMVFDQQYGDLKSALVAVSQRYGIAQAKLVEALAQHDNNLEAVVIAHQQQQQQALWQRQFRKACREFAELHQQSYRYVSNSVARYLDKDPQLTVEQALDKLLQERIIPLNNRR